MRRARRTRAKIRELGVNRLTVHRTPRHIYAQVLAPNGSDVLASASMVADHSVFHVVFENRRLPATMVGVDYFNEVALLRLSVPLGSSVRMSEEQSCAGRAPSSPSREFGRAWQQRPCRGADCR